MKKAIRATLCIPCYNCADQIQRMFPFLDKLSDHEICNEVVFIDNKSTDLTLRYLKEEVKKSHRPTWKVFSHDKNYGLGASFKTAYRHAQENECDFMIWMHGDDQARFEDLEKMLSVLQGNSFDVVWGARFAPESRLVNYSRARKWGNQALNLLYSLGLRQPIYDLGSGLNGYRVSSLSSELVETWPDHIAFDIELLFHFFSGDFRIKQLPILWVQEDQVSNAKNIGVAYFLLKSLILYKLGFRKRAQKKIHRGYHVY